MLQQPIFSHMDKLGVSDDEIDLRELFGALWKGKLLIVLCTAVFAVGGVIVALSKPNTYQAEASLVAANEDSGGGLTSMGGQLGGLASLAGINLGSGRSGDKAMSLAVLQSRQFINAFINRHQLLVPLMAAESWDRVSGEMVIDPALYDVETQQWIRKIEPPLSSTPSDWEAHKAFKEIFSVSEAKDNGLVKVSITHLSPLIAQQWVELLVKDLNDWIKNEKLTETRQNISYLEQQLEKTKLVDMQSVFYQLIEEQMKSLMLAEVKDEFAFKTIDPAVVPEEKAGPKRALICVLATLLGGMLGIAIVLVRFAFKKP
ncbi:LPS O-antigen length regulator [Vibrio anguillarum]|uniref:LPS O-antigen length regulator n=15 Tax=Vibrio anguillarum TaxID=55601 RepID=A0A290Q047_VIBAN|nr:Wzz/FepE/Etk N-terminal domain-containing protein [Vibrio anguillarum]ATC58688.1 LPS O-antigen length regulator [Vibrio anguillarum]AZS26452.1 LPS O-antigen length regulator [Vibrio anguillarum]MBF4223144.1 LPS O-antigen length regulator [Vibrio anguillarum]MBF4227266.1 LPS O-antigen length regulator [Vibrio anguillarum]MBF4248403.1 LPS O-antigen length regulator [Vibrio anguillarum]